jgi:hypothetical protein
MKLIEHLWTATKRALGIEYLNQRLTNDHTKNEENQ